MDEELEKMMEDALSEIKDLDNDTNEDEGEQKESTDSPDDGGEDGNNREDVGEDENDNDQEDIDLDEEESEDDEDNSQEDNEEDNEEDQEEQFVDFEPIEIDVNGQKLSINNKEEMLAFVKRGANSMNTKSNRKSQNDQIIEQGKLSQSDLTLLIDAKNGDKAAIAELAKNSGVDLYDIEDDSSYNPKFTPQFMSEADEVAEEFLQDKSFVDTFQGVIKSVPAEFVAEVSSNANALRNFGNQVKSGLAQKIIPEAMKRQLLNGTTFIQSYAEVGREMYNEEEKPTKESKTKRVKNPRAEKLRKQASNKKGSNKGQKSVTTGDDIWDMSDKEFMEKYGA